MPADLLDRRKARHTVGVMPTHRLGPLVVDEEASVRSGHYEVVLNPTGERYGVTMSAAVPSRADADVVAELYRLHAEASGRLAAGGTVAVLDGPATSQHTDRVALWTWQGGGQGWKTGSSAR